MSRHAGVWYTTQHLLTTQCKFVLGKIHPETNVSIANIYYHDTSTSYVPKQWNRLKWRVCFQEVQFVCGLKTNRPTTGFYSSRCVIIIQCHSTKPDSCTSDTFEVIFCMCFQSFNRQLLFTWGCEKTKNKARRNDKTSLSPSSSPTQRWVKKTDHSVFCVSNY